MKIPLATARRVAIALACIFAVTAAEGQTCSLKGDFGSVGNSLDKTFSDSLGPRSCFSGSRFFDYYAFSGNAGQVVTFVFTLTPRTNTASPTIAIARDINSSLLAFNVAGRNPASLTFTLLSSGSYVVILGTLETFAQGDYTLRGFSGSSPPATPTSTPSPTITPGGPTVTPTLVPRMPVVKLLPGPIGPRK